MPPPAEGLASRLFLAPALRSQPDRRLIALVREGYESAFEEIVRRYGRPLGRYAASIVGGRSEDVTQDAFSKALLAIRRDDAEIELRPWLFRIVRNTALNELRDSPPSPEMLAEAIAGGSNPAEELERREELADLMRRLQELPEAQRAAIVMRELEGLSHEEIAAALGLTGGGARQAIYRARRALRDGIGMLIPLPLMQSMLAAASTPGATETAAGAGVGAGIALKATAATVLVAGAVGAGVALKPGVRGGGAGATPVHASRGPVGGEVSDVLTGTDDNHASGEGGRHGADRGSGGDRGGHGEAELADDHGGGRRSVSGDGSPGGRSGPSGHHGTSEGSDDRSGPSHVGATSGSGSDSGGRRSDRDESGGGGSGSGGSGSSDSGSGSGSNDGANDGSGSGDAVSGDVSLDDGGSSGPGPGDESIPDGGSGSGDSGDLSRDLPESGGLTE